MSSLESLVCKTCGDEFARVDHLTRHVRSHNAERPFPCPICSKPFGRSDSLARHIRGHDSAINKPGSRRGIFHRVSHACTNCSKSKVRCDGKIPCQHCVARNLQCIREARQRGKSKTLNYSSSNGPSSVEQGETESASPDSGYSPHGEFLSSSPSANVLPINSTATLPSSTHTASEPRERRPNHETYTLTTPTLPTEQNAEYANYASFPNNGASSFQHLPNNPSQNPAQYGLLPLDAMGIGASWDHQHNISDWMTLDFFDPQEFFINEQLLDTPLLNVPLQQMGHPPEVSNLSSQPNGVFAGMLGEGSAVPNYGIGLSHRSVHHVGGTSVTGNNGHLRDHLESNFRQRNTAGIKERELLVSCPDFSGDYSILHTESYSHVEAVSQDNYDSLLTGLGAVCDGLQGPQKFILSTFPPRPVYNCFIQLYFEYYHAVFPLIHQATFRPSQCHWLEVLAVAAIGCRFSKDRRSLKCSHSLLWLLCRSIHHLVDSDYTIVATLSFTKAMLLNHIGMMYSGDKRFLEVGLVIGNSSATQCRRNDYLKGSKSSIVVTESTCGPDLEAKWTEWIEEEGRRRMGYICWILQCQLPLHFDLPASMRLSEMQQDLPCPDLIWNASSAVEWKPLYQKHKDSQPSRLTIHSVLHDLINHEFIPPGVGHLGLLALVHAIHETTFEMRMALKNPLFKGLSGSSPFLDETKFQDWQVRAGKLLELISSLGTAVDESMNSRPSHFSNWQSRRYIFTSAHHVSLLVFSPIEDLFNFAGSEPNSREKRDVEERLLEWVADNNGRTARRAVLHACMIFASIRSRSCHNFHEPIAFLVATLAIWTYNHLVTAQMSGSQNSHRTALRLDVSWNEKTAEAWMDGEPENTQGYLTDVGNINSHGAGKRLLKLAHETLLDLPAWGLSQGFAQFLDTLNSQMH